MLSLFGNGSLARHIEPDWRLAGIADLAKQKPSPSPQVLDVPPKLKELLVVGLQELL